MKAPTPILRIFDEARAREHYVGFLGFHADWEHRFGDNFPLYLQVSRGACVLHLSEHSGDACPGAAIRVETPDVDGFAAGLRAQDYKYFKPGVPETKPWGSKEIEILDPFGNRIIFYETVPVPPAATGTSG